MESLFSCKYMGIKINRILWPVCGCLLLIFVFSCERIDESEFTRYKADDPVVPWLSILQPGGTVLIHVDDTVFVRLRAGDNFASRDQLNLRLSSNLDGDLISSNPDVEGYADFELHSLSRGVHRITIRVSNPQGYGRNYTITISTLAPNRTTIRRAELVGSSHVDLEWDASPYPYFNTFEIYRTTSDGEQDLIAEIGNPSETTFRDFPPLDSLYKYEVRTTSRGTRFTNTSHPALIRRTLFGGGTQNHFPQPVILHYPNDPEVMIFYEGIKQKFDYESEEIKGNLDRSLSFAEIGSNGQGTELYLIESLTENGTPVSLLHIYDAHQLTLKETLRFEVEILSIASDNRGFLFTHLAGLSSSFATITRSNGHLQTGSDNQSFYTGTIRLVPGKREMYRFRNSASNNNVIYTTYSEQGELGSFTPWPYQGSNNFLTNSVFEVHPKGDFIVTGGNASVFEAGPDMTLRRVLGMNRGYRAFAFSNDGNVFIAVSNEWLDIYDSNLNRIGEIPGQWYPASVFHRGDYAVVVGYSTVISGKLGVTTVSLSEF